MIGFSYVIASEAWQSHRPSPPRQIASSSFPNGKDSSQRHKETILRHILKTPAKRQNLSALLLALRISASWANQAAFLVNKQAGALRALPREIPDG